MADDTFERGWLHVPLVACDLCVSVGHRWVLEEMHIIDI